MRDMRLTENATRSFLPATIYSVCPNLVNNRKNFTLFAKKIINPKPNPPNKINSDTANSCAVRAVIISPSLFNTDLVTNPFIKHPALILIVFLCFMSILRNDVNCMKAPWVSRIERSSYTTTPIHYFEIPNNSTKNATRFNQSSANVLRDYVFFKRRIKSFKNHYRRRPKSWDKTNFKLFYRGVDRNITPFSIKAITTPHHKSLTRYKQRSLDSILPNLFGLLDHNNTEEENIDSVATAHPSREGFKAGISYEILKLKLGLPSRESIYNQNRITDAISPSFANENLHRYQTTLRSFPDLVQHTPLIIVAKMVPLSCYRNTEYTTNDIPAFLGDQKFMELNSPAAHSSIRLETFDVYDRLKKWAGRDAFLLKKLENYMTGIYNASNRTNPVDVTNERIHPLHQSTTHYSGSINDNTISNDIILPFKVTPIKIIKGGQHYTSLIGQEIYLTWDKSGIFSDSTINKEVAPNKSSGFSYFWYPSPPRFHPKLPYSSDNSGSIRPITAEPQTATGVEQIFDPLFNDKYNVCSPPTDYDNKVAPPNDDSYILFLERLHPIRLNTSSSINNLSQDSNSGENIFNLKSIPFDSTAKLKKEIRKICYGSPFHCDSMKDDKVLNRAKILNFNASKYARPVSLGKTIILKCRINNRRLVTNKVRWFKDGRRIEFNTKRRKIRNVEKFGKNGYEEVKRLIYESNKPEEFKREKRRILITQQEKITILRVSRAKLSDSGSYHCQAKTYCGNIVRSAPSLIRIYHKKVSKPDYKCVILMCENGGTCFKSIMGLEYCECLPIFAGHNCQYNLS